MKTESRAILGLRDDLIELEDQINPLKHEITRLQEEVKHCREWKAKHADKWRALQAALEAAPEPDDVCNLKYYSWHNGPRKQALKGTDDGTT